MYIGQISSERSKCVPYACVAFNYARLNIIFNNSWSRFVDESLIFFPNTCRVNFDIYLLSFLANDKKHIINNNANPSLYRANQSSIVHLYVRTLKQAIYVFLPGWFFWIFVSWLDRFNNRRTHFITIKGTLCRLKLSLIYGAHCVKPGAYSC